MAKAARKRPASSSALRAKTDNTTSVDRPVKLGNPRMEWSSDVLAEVVRRLDLKYMALVPGASYRGFHDSIVNYLGNSDPQMLICLHEEHSVAIADGYARVTGKPMAAAIHTNVGLLHATMAIFDAWENRSPMVLFGANGPIDADQRRPWIEWVHTTKDHAALIRNYIKWDDEPQSPKAAIESILRGYQITCSQPTGPVYICLDAGLQESKLPKDVTIPDIERYRPSAPPAAPAKTIRDVLAAIKKAKLPVLMFGRGDVSKEAWDRRVKLAETLGCAVMSHLRQGATFPTEHPCHVVPQGARPGPEQKDLIAKADLLVGFDWLDLGGFLRLCTGESQTQNPIKAKVVRISLDQYLHNGWIMDYHQLPATDINVLADPDAVVQQLLDEVGAKGKPTGKPRLKPAVAKLKHWTKSAAAKAKPAATGAMSARDFHLTVSNFATDDPKISLCRVSTGFPGSAGRWRHPLDYGGNDNGGGVGAGPGQSVGMALAFRDLGRLPVTVLGDGDYLMGVNALWTAARMRIPMMVVVMNNRSYYNDEAHQHQVADRRSRATDNRWIGLRLDDPAPDLAGLARAQGFEAVGPIHDIEVFREELKRGREVVANGGQFMIDAWIIPDDAVARRQQDGGRGK